MDLFNDNVLSFCLLTYGVHLWNTTVKTICVHIIGARAFFLHRRTCSKENGGWTHDVSFAIIP